jgi:hypothetical protein
MIAAVDARFVVGYIVNVMEMDRKRLKLLEKMREGREGMGRKRRRREKKSSPIMKRVRENERRGTASGEKDGADHEAKE